MLEIDVETGQAFEKAARNLHVFFIFFAFVKFGQLLLESNENKFGF